MTETETETTEPEDVTARWVYLGRQTLRGGKTAGQWLDLRYDPDDDEAIHTYADPSARFVVGAEYEVRTNERGTVMRGTPLIKVYRSEALSDVELARRRLADETFKLAKGADSFAKKNKGDVGSMTLAQLRREMAAHPIERGAMLAAALRFLGV